MIRVFLPTTLAALLAGGMAMAAFTDADADGDGMMSADEFVAAYPDGTEDQFAAADADADGMVSADEYAAAIDAGILPAD